MNQTLFNFNKQFLLFYVSLFWWVQLFLTFDEQVARGADGSRLTGGGAGEAAAVFSERLADHQPGVSARVADLEVDGVLDLVVLSEPHDAGSGVAADLTLQSHRLTLRHRHVLQALNSKEKRHQRF